MPVRMKSSSISDFSDLTIYNHHLEKGLEIRAYYENGKKIRSDKEIRRRIINQKTVIQLKDDKTVSDFLDEARKMLTPAFQASRKELRLFWPTGEEVDVDEPLENLRRRKVSPKNINKVQAKDVLWQKFLEIGIDDVSIKKFDELFELLLNTTGGRIVEDLIKVQSNDSKD